MQDMNDRAFKRCLALGDLSLLSLACAVCAPPSAWAAAPGGNTGTVADQAAAVVVDGPQRIGPVNRRILGNNILAYQESPRKIYAMQGGGLWDPETAAPVPEMIACLKESGAKTLRWPGGCGSHAYNWKLTVGPLSGRPTQAFGLPEFLKCCEAADATPIITLGDYWGSPADFADIVEYLNAPLGKNPNGGTDWAAIRAQDGHPEPYYVVWFEYGNESSHGPHGKTQDVWFEYGNDSNQGPKRKTKQRDAWYAYTPAQYSALYRKVQAAMKAVDPKIKLGAVLENEYQPRVWHDWTYEVVKLTGACADFYITHLYLASYNLTDGRLPATELFRLTFSSARQVELVLGNLSQYIKTATGRDIPLAITEFNVGIDQEKPVPYRFSQGAAIQVAEMALTMMSHPEFNVDNAQYWQFSNEHWGMISHFKDICLAEKRAEPIKRPPFLAYALCNKYLGDTFVKSAVSGGSYATRGGFGMQPATGDPSVCAPPLDTARRMLKPNWKITPDVSHLTQIAADGTLSVKILDKPLDFCQAQLHVPTKPLITYQITAEIKTDGNPNFGVGFEVGDGRGWNVFSRSSTAKGTKSSKWVETSCQYESLCDAPNLTIRLKCTGNNVTDGLPFTFAVRNVTIKEIGAGQDLGRIPYVQCYASTSRDGGRKMILVNRNLFAPVTVRVKGLKSRVTSAETLSAPAVDATNEQEQNCRISPLRCSTLPDGTLELTLPPHSLSGVATR